MSIGSTSDLTKSFPVVTAFNGSDSFYRKPPLNDLLNGPKSTSPNAVSERESPSDERSIKIEKVEESVLERLLKHCIKVLAQENASLFDIYNVVYQKNRILDGCRVSPSEEVDLKLAVLPLLIQHPSFFSAIRSNLVFFLADLQNSLSGQERERAITQFFSTVFSSPKIRDLPSCIKDPEKYEKIKIVNRFQSRNLGGLVLSPDVIEKKQEEGKQVFALTEKECLALYQAFMKSNNIYEQDLFQVFASASFSHKKLLIPFLFHLYHESKNTLKVVIVCINVIDSHVEGELKEDLIKIFYREFFREGSLGFQKMTPDQIVSLLSFFVEHPGSFIRKQGAWDRFLDPILNHRSADAMDCDQLIEVMQQQARISYLSGDGIGIFVEQFNFRNKDSSKKKQMEEALLQVIDFRGMNLEQIYKIIFQNLSKE